MAPNATTSAAARDGHFTDSTIAASSAKKGRFSWQEVAKHNTAESAWVIVDGKVYDITKFMDKHPGGREMLLLSAGRECTDLFNSYHWLNPGKPRAIISKYEIGELVGPTELPTFAPDTAGFYKTLSDRVRAYFERTKQNPKSPVAGLWRLLLILTCAFTALYAMTMAKVPFTDITLTWPAQLAAAVVFGIFQAMPLLHAMHDASHTAIGGNELWWKTIGRLCLDWFAGGMMISWHHQHVVGHHLYTNVFLADPDIPYTVSGDVRYLVPGQSYNWVYKYQWLYLPVLYGVLGFRTRVQDVLTTWLANDCGPVRVNFYNSPWFRVVFTKLVWASWRIYLPLYVLNVPSAAFWACFWVSEVMTGYWLAWNFEVSHVADTVIFPREYTIEEAKKISKGEKVPFEKGAVSASRDSLQKVQRVITDCWAAVQVKTSVDYGHNSWLTAFWTGALNYQIEHHLFPGISQYYYPEIAPIVMDTCKEFGIPYRLEPSFWSAWCAHLRLLYIMGQKGVPYKWD